MLAKGFTQEEGFNFFETFSPVIKPSTICLVLSIVTMNEQDIHQLDVKNAFLYSVLQQFIFIEQPLGFVIPQDLIICAL